MRYFAASLTCASTDKDRKGETRVSKSLMMPLWSVNDFLLKIGHLCYFFDSFWLALDDNLSHWNDPGSVDRSSQLLLPLLTCFSMNNYQQKSVLKNQKCSNLNDPTTIINLRTFLVTTKAFSSPIDCCLRKKYWCGFESQQDQKCLFWTVFLTRHKM